MEVALTSASAEAVGTRQSHRTRRLLTLGLAIAAALPAFASSLSAQATPSSQLTRYPYITDDSSNHATVELATLAQSPPVVLTYGTSPGCSGSTVSASGSPITVGSTKEYQFTLHLTGLAPGTTYCYGITQNGANLLGSDSKPSFKSALAAGDTTPFSFAVIGDWGQNATGPNPQLAGLMTAMHSSGASFAISTGDAAYNDGSQTNYGDLYQTGNNVSAVFGPNYWAKNGASIPMFATMGDHGFSTAGTFFQNWNATDSAADSGGKYQLETYSGKDGTTAANYPSIWYAFNWGQARFYMLTGVWGYSNNGTASQYQVDYDYHWAPGTPQMNWLQNDLLQHASTPAKFAFVYFPFHSDNNSQPTDTYYSGATGLESFLANNKVTVAFNGHAHIYERNKPQAGSMATYIGGGGGGVLEPVSSCSSFDGYALGWSPTKSVGYSCNAPVPNAQNLVNEYMLVTVNGSTVTVAPTNANGTKFDVQNYPVGTIVAGAATHFSVSTPTTATAGNPFNATITAQDGNNNTATKYAGPKTLNWSGLGTSPNGTAPVYPANPVTFNNGIATVSMTPYSAQTGTVSTNDGSISGTSPSLTVSPGAAAGFMPAAPGGVIAGHVFSEKISAVDAYGNTATSFGGTKTLTFSGPHNAPNGTAPTYPATAGFSSGVGTASITLYDAESTALTASSGTLTGTSSVFTVVGSSINSLAPASPGPQVAGVPFIETVAALDKYGNVSPSFTGVKTVTWSGAASSPNGKAPSYTSSVTFNAGVGNATTTLYNVQTLQLTAKQGSTTVYTGTSAPFSVGPGAASVLSLASPGTQTAGVSFNQTLTAFDAYGNAATTYNGSPSLSWSGPSNAPDGTHPSYPSNVSFTNGLGSASITLFSAQTTHLTAAQGSLSGTSPNFNVGPNATAALKPATPSSSPTAGTAFNETVTATDNWGNTTPGYSGSESLTWSGPDNSPYSSPPTYPSNVTFTNGVGTAGITLTDSESTSFHVTDGSNSGDSGSFFVKPAAASSLSPATPATQTAGQSFTETVTAFDPFGNIATGYHGTLSWSGPGQAPNGANPSYSSVTFNNGVGSATINLKKAEDAALTASDGSISGTSGTFTVAPGATTSLALTIPASVDQNTPAAASASVFDAFGNLGTGDNSTLTISSSDSSCGSGLTCPVPASLPNSNTVTLSQGQVSFEFAFSDCGTQSMTVSETANVKDTQSSAVAGLLCPASAAAVTANRTR